MKTSCEKPSFFDLLRLIGFLCAVSECHGIPIRIENPGDSSVATVVVGGEIGRARPFGEAAATVGGVRIQSVTTFVNTPSFAQMIQALDFGMDPAPEGSYLTSYFNVYFHLDRAARYHVAGLMTWSETEGDAAYRINAIFKPGGVLDPNLFYENELTKGKSVSGR